MLNEIREKLCGWTIIEPVVDSEDRDFYGFLVRRGSKQKIVWVTRDPEGNGPGHLDIDPVQK